MAVIKKILWVLLAVLVILPLGLFLAAQIWQMPGEASTPSAVTRNTSLYIEAADGTGIAVDIWLPTKLNQNEKVHTVIEGTRYWRQGGLTRLGRVLAMLGLGVPGAEPPIYASFFNSRGYAFVAVDVRGTGASYGVHGTEYSVQEVADYKAVLDWIVAQPWSTGSVASIGVSYSGTSAELMIANQHPALKAAAPRYSDFDTQFHLATPGGIFQPAFIAQWSELVAAMDSNDFCRLGSIGRDQDLTEGECRTTKLFFSGVKPVDDDEDQSMLAAAVAEHNSPNVAEMVANLKYRDSEWAQTGYTSATNQVYARKTEIEAAGTPMYLVTGWFDAATTDGALARFASFSNPQSVWIGPFDHGGGNHIDPYLPADTATLWSGIEQLDRIERFFAAELDGKGLRNKVLNYYVMGEGVWRETEQWPPTHLTVQRFHLHSGSRLAKEISPAVDPAMDAAYDAYQVDFDIGTSPDTRWVTQLGDRDVVYQDRNAHITKTQTYRTPPFAEDQELTGTVVVDLWMSSSAPDGALHIYLDDVDPEGHAVYLTEGVLRLAHRAETDQPDYPTFGPARSYLENDARPMIPGEIERVRVGLYATSALIAKGHHLRLSIAGADATSFAPVPATGEGPKLKFYRGPQYPSAVSLPLATLATWRR